MSQAVIYELLKKTKKPMSRKEIAVACSIREEVVSKRIKKMLTYHDIDYIELDRVQVKDYCEQHNLPRVKQRMRLYFIKD